jgi:multiple sugar transport system substrate-binding protein
MKRIICTVIALVAMGAAAFAGGTTEAPAKVAATTAIRWSFWGSEARIKNTQLAIDKFTEATSIIVAAEPAPGTGEHFAKFKTQFAGGNAADIIQLGGDFSNLGVGMDVGSVLMPLDAFVKSGALDISKIDASAIAAGTVDGKLYALPLAANMPGILYNKSLLERVGAPLPKVSMTWDEFNAWLAAVGAKLPTGVYAFADNSSNTDQSYFFGYWTRQNGTRMWDGTKSYVKAADAQKYFDMWAGWRAAKLIADPETAGAYAETNESTSSLIAGKVAACVIWSNQLLNYSKATKDSLDLIEMPNAVASKMMWGQMSQMMAINKNSKNGEAAAKFISYRVNDAGVWKIMGADPGNPVNSEARSVVATDDIAKKVAAYINVAGQHASARDPNMPNDSQWNNRLFVIAQSVAFGKITTAQAGQQVVDLIAELTKK